MRAVAPIDIDKYEEYPVLNWEQYSRDPYSVSGTFRYAQDEWKIQAFRNGAQGELSVGLMKIERGRTTFIPFELVDEKNERTDD